MNFGSLNDCADEWARILTDLAKPRSRPIVESLRLVSALAAEIVDSDDPERVGVERVLQMVRFADMCNELEGEVTERNCGASSDLRRLVAGDLVCIPRLGWMKLVGDPRPDVDNGALRRLDVVRWWQEEHESPGHIKVVASKNFLSIRR